MNDIRMYRGGSWTNTTDYCRVMKAHSKRDCYGWESGHRFNHIGFRVIRRRKP